MSEESTERGSGDRNKAESDEIESFFAVGKLFASFAELEAKLEEYKRKKFVEFWIRDSRTIKAASKRGVDRPLAPALKYYEIKYCCIHGGQAFKARGKGIRSSSYVNMCGLSKICLSHVMLS